MDRPKARKEKPSAYLSPRCLLPSLFAGAVHIFKTFVLQSSEKQVHDPERHGRVEQLYSPLPLFAAKCLPGCSLWTGGIYCRDPKFELSLLLYLARSPGKLPNETAVPPAQSYTTVTTRGSHLGFHPQHAGCDQPQL